MDIDHPAVRAVTNWLAIYGPYLATGAGAVGALVAAYAIRKWIRTREHDDFAGKLGVFLFLVVTTEGMWEVVHKQLGVGVWLAIVMFGAFDAVIYAQGRAAVKAVTKSSTARVAGYLLIIWAMSIAASITVSMAGGNAATQFFRFFSPLVAAALWTQKVMALRKVDSKAEESSWIWTPARLGVRLGLLKPGAVSNLDEVFQQRRVGQLVNQAMEVYVLEQAAKLGGTEKVSRWRPRRDRLATAERRLQQLAKTADQATVDAAREQLRRTLAIRTTLFAPPAPPVDDRTQTTLDDVRLLMRDATTSLRGQHQRAFAAPAQPAIVDRPRRLWPDPDATPPAVTAAVETPAIAPAETPAGPAPAGRQISAAKPARKTVSAAVKKVGPGRPPKAAEKAARVVARNPDLKPAEIARKTGVSETTARRVLKDAKPTEES
ncbi:hypothetical protein [Polymorphospora rubra]|uniref:Uncharacterized protein n=1 Tax=Polymorphospora rubra TaxID=338584 RepID=A0A810MXU4_9ACTN|nr:hypothetical protein [Polymorphospora rubra]BCJ64168.1 hypothetical protein Prubr_11890 [Polymorphospora rubra]